MKVVAIVLFGGCALLHADCPEGVYSYNSNDLKFLNETYTTLKSSIPAAPEGCRLDDKNHSFPSASVCKGAEKEPLILAHTVEYVWVAGEKELALKLGELERSRAAVRRTPMPTEQQKLMNDLGNRDRDLRFQARKLAAMNKTEADRLNLEAAGYSKQNSQRLFKVAGT
jgi:hypothetical protein